MRNFFLSLLLLPIAFCINSQNQPPTRIEFTAGGVSFSMVKVEGGSFMMGATEEQGDDAGYSENPAHMVTLSDYYIATTEVTQELWQAVMGNNPSYFNGSHNAVHGNHNDYGINLQRPVETVSWDDCQAFITKLNQQTGESFRLPTEAEWEFAARGGNMSQHCKYAGSNSVDDVAWSYENCGSQASTEPGYGTQSVGSKAPNELGLYDMSGNVREWCQDWWSYYNGGDVTNPTGPATGYYRVTRSGCWNWPAIYCRVSYRYFVTNKLDGSVGLRLAMTKADDTPTLRGDINLDGTVDVIDVNIMINIILKKAQASDYGTRAFINDDDIIDVSDLNDLVNIVLSN